MKFTYSWIKDYVDITISPQELADKLTMAGLQIESLKNTGQDWVFQAEVTTNRPDLLSMLGIAREVSAILGKRLNPPVYVYDNVNRLVGWPKIQISDTAACHRYTGRIITDLKIAESPGWLKDRIKSIGLRPINNIVDVTNFVLFETGQPLHAFDLNNIKGGYIQVRRAKDNEQIVTIDDQARKLDPDILIIAGEEGPLAIAGVMGGRDSQVTEATKNVLLESAYFDPLIVRRAAKKLGLTTDSSYRFERGVDSEALKSASARAVELILKLAGGSSGKLVDAGKKKYSMQRVSVRPQRVNDLLGVEVPQKFISAKLALLGLKSVPGAKIRLSFTVPSLRRDLRQEVDLIEEIARLWGYDNIPQIPPQQINALSAGCMPRHFAAESAARDALVSFGLVEALSYSLVDKKYSRLCQPDSLIRQIFIKNPLSEETAALRTNLIDGILSAASWNINRNINDIKIFQIGKVYSAGDDARPQEETCLAVFFAGNRREDWQDGQRPLDFYYLKGIIEALLYKLGIKEYDIASAGAGQDGYKILDVSQNAVLKLNNKAVGFFGKLGKGPCEEFGIKKDCFICHLKLDALIEAASFEKIFETLPRFPSVTRDISLLAQEAVPCKKITDLIKEAAGSLTCDVKLFDVYSAQDIKAGYKSLAFRLTYQLPDRTLTSEEVDSAHSEVISLLIRNQIQIR